MKDYFTSDFFADNRARLRSLFQGTAPIVITANGLLQQSSDSTFPFKQDGNFWYLTGLNDPDVILVMDRDKEYLIVPDLSDYQRDFNGAFKHEAITERSGIIQILDQKNGWKQLEKRLKKVTNVATLSPPPAYAKIHGFYTNPARATLVAKIKEFDPSIELLDLRAAFATMRMVKQQPELDAIQQAIDVTVKSLKQVKTKLKKYKNEYEAEAELAYNFRKNGGAGHAFDPIVAGGANACVVHYMDNNSPLKSGDLLLFDVGAEVSQYASDISRTYALSTPTKRQKQIFDSVCEVQDYAYSLLKPGVIIREYEKQVHHFMGEKLRTLGLIKNVEPQEISKYFPHSTSHHLGFDVHDVGDYDLPLEPGMIITVEPGIYIAEEGIGVRIEDDVLITENGIQILTKSLPREL